MSAIQATTAATATAASAGDTATTTDASTTASAKKSFATLFTEAKADLKKGEALTKVSGHEFARIKGGSRDDMCINLSGNDRSGQAFDLIWRNGRQFHVYGTGADHTVVEVGKKAGATTTTSSTDSGSAVSTGGASSTTSSTGATSTG